MNKKHVYTKEHIDYIRSIAEGRYNDEITEMFNDKFNLRVSTTAMNTLKSKNGIVSNLKSKLKPWYKEEYVEYLRSITKNQTNKQITKLFNEKFDLRKSERAIRNLRLKYDIETSYRKHFKKGSSPWNAGTKGLMRENSGSFKKGSIPPNRASIGSERFGEDGYVMIKVVDGKKNRNWRAKHHILYEREHGSIPRGNLIIFADGDVLNFDIDNLLCITRKEHLMLNQSKLQTDNAEMVKTQLQAIRLMNKVDELEYGENLDMSDDSRIFELRKGFEVLSVGTISEIAVKMNITEATVKNYGTVAYRKGKKSKNFRRLYYHEEE